MRDRSAPALRRTMKLIQWLKSLFKKKEVRKGTTKRYGPK